MLTLTLILIIGGLIVLNLMALSSRRVVVYQVTTPAETAPGSGCLLWFGLLLLAGGLMAWILAGLQ